jgi:hypothetical protein
VQNAHNAALRSRMTAHTKCPRDAINVRGRGTERANSRRAGNATNQTSVASSLEASPGASNDRRDRR